MRSFHIVLATVLLAGCDVGKPEAKPAPASWSIPAEVVLQVGQLDTIEVLVRDADGRVISDAYPTFSINCLVDRCVASVSELPRDRSRLELVGLSAGQVDLSFYLGYDDCQDPPMCYVKWWVDLLPAGHTKVTVVNAD